MVKLLGCKTGVSGVLIQDGNREFENSGLETFGRNSLKSIADSKFQFRSRVESRRSFRVKADDPEKDQSRRSRSKADDPWVKADDPSKSRRSFVKADDLLGSKQTIFVSKQTIQGESGRS